MRILFLPTLLALALQSASPAWVPLTTGTTARLRGISAVSDRIVWASGTNGTVVRSIDGGATWQRLPVPAADKLDFRDVDAVSSSTAYVLSIGNGELSRIYKTADAGVTWTEQFVNRDPKAFFDAMSFWDPMRGVAVSDSIDGQFVILTTSDGGKTWTRVPAEQLPAALPNEGFFAASGTNVATVAPNHVWIATGAASEARVLRSADGGRTWALSKTPLAAGPSAGIFSIAFRDAKNGIVVGGDYKLESTAVDNAAITTDGGATWTPIKGLSGFRSAVGYVRGGVVAVGPSGVDYSRDDGRTWTALSAAASGYHTLSIDPGRRVVYAAGDRGSAARIAID